MTSMSVNVFNVSIPCQCVREGGNEKLGDTKTLKTFIDIKRDTEEINTKIDTVSTITIIEDPNPCEARKCPFANERKGNDER